MRLSMLRKLLSMVICTFVFSAAVYAQGSISGTVTDARTGETMPGVNVVITELQRGTSTDADGQYEIQNIPSGTYTLRATFVGYRAYSTEIEVGASDAVHDIAIQQDITGLDEVVVTGVGSGTQTKKLGFSVAKISEQELSKVPAASVGSALYGKTSGISIISASGDPASAPSIRLRGSTSINGDQEPLVIIDGVITSGSLQDINMQDVQSIEIVKGAAAASIYGSLAGNGVIQVITKRASESIGKPSVTVRSEYGFSEIAKDYPLATTHPWVNDATVSDGYIESWPGYETYDSDRTWDNEFPIYYDNVDAIFTGKAYNTNYVRIGGTAEVFNYSASFENMSQGGVIESLPDYNRNTVRFNADYTQVENFNLSFSGSYVNAEYPYFTEQGQGSNYFYSALTAPPFVSLLEKNEATGKYSNQPTGYGIAGSNWQNPLYVAQNRERNIDRDRWIVGVTANYDVTDWLSLNARQSMDKRNQVETQHTPVGYQTPTPSTVFNNGFEGIENLTVSTSVTELWAGFNQTFGDINISGNLKYLYEDRNYEEYYEEGYNYTVSGIRNIGATDPNTLFVSSQIEEERVENYIGNVDIDYQDKIIVGGMLRRDGSSLFGEDERYNLYYRGSLAYRLTEDVDINNIDELKLRASYGTSGNRPPWQAQYETYSPSGTALTPETLGNSEIKPSVVGEAEFGVDVTFLQRYNFTANYALTNVKNDYIQVPLPGTSAFPDQWQNVGEIESTSLEFQLGGQLVQQRDMTLNFNLSFSRTTQEITDLGGAPAFTRGTQSGFDAAIDLFRFEEGVPYGAMYGNKLISSVSELTVDESGIVQNIPGDYTRDDFTVNQLGHVVLAENQGTQDERPMFLVDENGDLEVTNIGNTQPDFQVGFSTDFNYKGFGVYMVWDWWQGGDVYNYTRQLLYNRYLHKDLETYTRQGLDPLYATAADGLYNGSEAISHFVEDASFLKLREASLSYTFDSETLGALGNHLKSIQLAVVGRNLLTFTEYGGFDPEVALRSNATNFRIDEYAYPNFRTYSASVQVSF